MISKSDFHNQCYYPRDRLSVSKSDFHNATRLSEGEFTYIARFYRERQLKMNYEQLSELGTEDEVRTESYQRLNADLWHDFYGDIHKELKVLKEMLYAGDLQAAKFKVDTLIGELE